MDLPLDEPGGSPAGNPAAARTPTALADDQAPLPAVDAWWANFSPGSGFEPQALAFTLVPSQVTWKCKSRTCDSQISDLML